MDDTLLRRLIQRADCQHHSLLRSFLFARFDRLTGVLQHGASFAAKYSVKNTLLFALLITLDLRLNVCQISSSKYILTNAKKNFTRFLQKTQGYFRKEIAHKSIIG
jgi:hypothetical protein